LRTYFVFLFAREIACCSVKLEIKGFKSFGDKMVINFDKGITGSSVQMAVVNPNVVDAIRGWVLRGAKDSIAPLGLRWRGTDFNGTKTRKPSNLAERVSLTF